MYVSIKDVVSLAVWSVSVLSRLMVRAWERSHFGPADDRTIDMSAALTYDLYRHHLRSDGDILKSCDIHCTRWSASHCRLFIYGWESAGNTIYPIANTSREDVGHNLKGAGMSLQKSLINTTLNIWQIFHIYNVIIEYFWCKIITFLRPIEFQVRLINNTNYIMKQSAFTNEYVCEFGDRTFSSELRSSKSTLHPVSYYLYGDVREMLGWI